LADFNNFWQVTLRKNLVQMTVVHLDIVATLPCEMQKSLFSLQS